MTKAIGTTDLVHVWAHDGTRVAPDESKANTGFQSGERPPYQVVNEILHRLEADLNLLKRNSGAPWNAVTNYLTGDVVNIGGALHVALSDNINKNPLTQPEWQQITV